MSQLWEDAFEEILEKDGRALDENQRKAVFCDRNCVVKAGAGSGKTTVLAYRFLRLVLEGRADCDQILTLTFTKKAASEMNERIYLRLLSSGNREQLAKFPDATISTMDSFFSGIVKADSLRYGLTGDFTVASDEDIESSLQVISTRVLNRHKGTPELQALASLYRPDDLLKMVIELGTECFSLDRHYDGDSWYRRWEDRIIDVFLHKAQPDLAFAADDLSRCLKNEGNLEMAARAEKLCNWKQVPDKAELKELLAALSGIAINGQKDRKTAEFPDKGERIGEFRSRLEKFYAAAYALSTREKMRGVFSMLCEIQDEILAFKRSSCSVSFLDVNRMALDILKTNKGLRKFYKQKFKFIMIDEFQDNNELQKEILYLLSESMDSEGDGVPPAGRLEGSKLFFVGDEKQSIYRFRGADVSVFKSLSAELEAEGGVSISLDTNYRTEPELIGEFNQVFARLMGKATAPYEADFEKLGCRGKREGVTSRLVFCGKPEAEKDGADEAEELGSRHQAEASFIADLVRRMVSTDDFLIPAGKGQGLRRPGYSDIAVLLRSLSNQNHFEKAFRIADVPYCLQQTRALMADAVSNDICNVLQLCLFPEDTLASLGVLSSPLCRLEGADLQKAMAAMPFGPAELSPEGSIRYRRAAAKFQELRTMAGNSTIARMMEFIWWDWGYRYFLLTKKNSQSFLEHFDSLWTLANTFDQQNASLADFMSYVRPRLGANERLKDFEILREKEEGVRIMTIHKSKGLEFPIVIVANAGNRPKTSDKSLVFIDDDETPYVRHMEFPLKLAKSICTNLLLLFSKDDEKLKEIAEGKRVLYVGLTRAETHLVVSGTQSRNNGRTSFLEDLGEGMGIEVSKVLQKSGGSSMAELCRIPDIAITQAFLTNSGIKESCRTASGVVYAGTRAWNNISLPNRMGVTSFVREAEELSGTDGGEVLPAVDSDFILDKYSCFEDFGTLCHAVLELGVNERRLPESREVFQMLDSIAGLGALSSSEGEVLVRDALEMASGFLDSPFFQSISDVPKYTELAFFCGADSDGRRIAVEGKIDLLIEFDDNWVILDYKTDRVLSPGHHRGQLALYTEAIRRVTDLPVRSCLCYLRRPGEICWLE